jgi:hypothetical protein
MVIFGEWKWRLWEEELSLFTIKCFLMQFRFSNVRNIIFTTLSEKDILKAKYRSGGMARW